MAPPGASPVARAEAFVWLTARVLEQRRFAYHFLDGSPDAVEAALTAYRGEDGGYGHALDPDLRGPVSQPHHTAHALRVLDEIGRCTDRRAELVCRYLTAVSTPEGALPALHPASAAWPAAPWFPAPPGGPGAPAAGSLLTTGPVVGLLHRNAVWHAWLFRATDFCWAAIDALVLAGRPHPYEVEAAVAFLDGAPDRARAEAAADRLGRVVREQRLAVLDPERAAADPPAAGSAAHHFPHDYARTPDSLARPWFTDTELGRSLDHLAAAQQEDGGWPLRRGAWAPGTALEGRPLTTVEALLTLRAHGRGSPRPNPPHPV